MAHAEEQSFSTPMSQQNVSLAMEWRRLRRAATIVGLFTAPAFFIWLYSGLHWSLPVALIVTAFGVAAFRGLIDVVVRRLLPWPSMYGADDGWPRRTSSPAGACGSGASSSSASSSPS